MRACSLVKVAVTWRVVMLALAAAGCGARTGLADIELPAARDGAAPPDADVLDAGTSASACPRLDARACRPTFPSSLALADGALSQGPDVAWTGDRLLAAWWNGTDIAIVGVGLDGTILSRRTARGINFVRVEWNPMLRVAVVVADSVVHWVAPDGSVIGSFDARIPSAALAGDAWPTRSGFELLGGVLAYTEPPGLGHAALGAIPAPIVWETLEASGPYGAASHTVGDDGLASWGAVVGVEYPSAVLYRLDSERIVERTEVGPVIPRVGASTLHAIVEHAGVVYGLADLPPLPGEAGWTQWIVPLVPGGLGPLRVDRSGNGGGGDLVELGGALVVVSPAVSASHTVSMTTVDLVAGTVGDLLALSGPSPYSHSPRIARVPRGLAVVWNEGSADGLTTKLQVLDCCATE